MRNYGIDILKIVAMMCVVMLHVFGSGGVLAACEAEGTFAVKSLGAQLFYSWLLPAVDCFVMATGFVMWNRDGKPKRLLGLWLQVVFYGLCFAFIARTWYPSIPLKWHVYLKSVLPVSFNRLWFFTQFVALFVTMPLLNLAIRQMDLKFARRAVAAGFVVLSVVPSCWGTDLFCTHYGYSYVWFCYLYLCGAVVSRFGDELNVSGRALAVTFAVCGVLNVLGHGVQGCLWPRLQLSQIPFWGGLVGYTSPMVLVEAFCAVVLFSRLKVTRPLWIKAIGFVSPFVFAVYAIHSQPVFRLMVQWRGRFAPLADGPLPLVLLGVLLCAAAVFVICIGIEFIRQKLFRLLRIPV